MKRFIILLCVSVMFSSLFARSRDNSPSIITQVPNLQLRVHRASNIEFSITNYGIIGSQGQDEIDPETGEPAPSAEFPAGSNLEHLFQGCLWIGAVVEDPHNPGVFDTLVSVGNDGWWGSIFEFFPPPMEYESIWKVQYIGDEEYYAIYFDTVTYGVTPDPNDGRPHIPLGLKITHHSLCWSSPGYDEFFVINYYIENIYDRDLQDVWLGIYYDGDVMHMSENPYGPDQGAQDDLCGFVELDSRGITWIIDNDGQPYGGVWDPYLSSRGVMGMVLLGSSTPVLQTNFNWWISHVVSELDWGPQWQSNFDIWGIFPGGGRGTPGGDKAKYQVMSNGEHDYDQPFCALDWTNEGWIPPVANASDLANGYDTRYLISLGPFQLAGGEIETLTIAYVGGHNLHRDPNNYANNLQDNTDDSLSIVEYYNNLDFSDLTEKADTALYYYLNGIERIPVSPPPNFRELSHNEIGEPYIQLTWNQRNHPLLLEYRIYRGIESGNYDPEKITPDNFLDTVFVDYDVQVNTTYYYVITSANNLGMEGGYSDEVIVDWAPHPPESLTVERCPISEVELEWLANPEGDLAGYIIYRSEQGDDFETLDTVNTITYTDTEVSNGIKYSYAITAFDTSGNESSYSDTVSATPMAFDEGILLINANTFIVNPDYDSMVVFYQNLLDGYQYTIVDSPPDSLPQFAPYSTVIWCKELIFSNFYFDPYDYDNLYSDYLDACGNLIIAGTRNLTPAPTYEDTLLFGTSGFPYRYLNLEGVEYPSWRYNTEFIGGESVSPFYPDFSVDTARANRIVFPSGDNDGRLFGIGVLIPNESSEVIYSHIAVNPDTSNFHGRPIGILHDEENYKTAVLEFPLYYVEEPTSFDILHQVLEWFDEQVGIYDPSVTLPEKISLLQNYPNPFNAATVIKYNLPQSGPVKLSIYNLLGQCIETLYDGVQQAGMHSIVWDASACASGIYFYKLTAGGKVFTKRMTLLK